MKQNVAIRHILHRIYSPVLVDFTFLTQLTFYTQSRISVIPEMGWGFSELKFNLAMALLPTLVVAHWEYKQDFIFLRILSACCLTCEHVKVTISCSYASSFQMSENQFFYSTYKLLFLRLISVKYVCIYFLYHLHTFCILCVSQNYLASYWISLEILHWFLPNTIWGKKVMYYHI